MAGVTNKEIKKDLDSKVKDIYTTLENVMKRQELLGNTINDIIKSINLQQQQISELENSLNIIAEKTLNNIALLKDHSDFLESYSDKNLGALKHLVNNINKIIDNNIEQNKE